MRTKKGIFGRFSLWFPLLTILGAAWVMLWLVPSLLASWVWPGQCWLAVAYTGNPGST